MDITNKHTPELIDIKGVVKWIDSNDKDGVRPDQVTVNLYADGEKIDSKTVTASSKKTAGSLKGAKAVNSKTATAGDGWAWSFSSLPKYKDGKEIKYTVTEDKVDAYTTEITGDAKDGFTITNTHVSKKGTPKNSDKNSTGKNSGSTAAGGSNPSTGDYVHYSVYLLLLIAAGLALVWVFRKRHNSQ